MRRYLIILFFIIGMLFLFAFPLLIKAALFKNTPLDMVYIQAGSFKMGTNDFLFLEGPRHFVELTKNYFMSKYEITNKQAVDVYNWAYKNNKIIVTQRGVINYIGDKKLLIDLYDEDCLIKFTGNEFRSKLGKENYPCVEISWYGALAFCNFLSEMEGLMPAYDYYTWSCNWDTTSYRLPTEAEWEYAASGGVKSRKYEFSGSNNAILTAWYNKNSLDNTHKVGIKSPNELGLYDMSGNVWEWCWDWYNNYYYLFSPVENPKGPRSGQCKITRGGSWYLGLYNCRNTSRSVVCDPEEAGHHGGFRIIRTMEDMLVFNN